MDDLCVDSDDICSLHTQGAPPPQLNIGVFAHMLRRRLKGMGDDALIGLIHGTSKTHQ